MTSLLAPGGDIFFLERIKKSELFSNHDMSVRQTMTINASPKQVFGTYYTHYQSQINMVVAR